MAAITHELPDWEVTSSPPKKSIFSKANIFSTQPPQQSKEDVEEGSTSARRAISIQWLSRARAFAGRSNRRLLYIIIGGVLLLVLILGLGLGLGLSHRTKKARNLPLPTNTGIFTGDLTYYSPGPGYGACGFENTSTDSICAVSHIIWDASSTSSNPNNNPLCGKKIRITRYDPTVGGNRSVDVEVVDRCVGCQATDLDLSLAMFTSLAEEAQGRVVGSWAWLT